MKCCIAVSLMVLLIVPIPAAVWQDDFSQPPFDQGWKAFGDAALFVWDSTRETLQVTWDSSRTNSYYHRPLGTILTLQDDFRFAFDLRLQDIAIGVDAEKPYTFQLAVGLIGIASAMRTNFFRGSGLHATFGPRNLMTFDYFPDSGFGATFAPTAVSTNNRIAFSDNHPLELTVNDLFRVDMEYSADEHVLRTTVTRNGEMYGLGDGQSIQELPLSQFPDLRLDSFAICSFSDGQQFPQEFAGSILAHGWVDNVEVIVPDPPVTEIAGGLFNGVWKVQFMARNQWTYELRRSLDFRTWRTVDSVVAKDSGIQILSDANTADQAAAYYQIVATRP